MTTDSLPTAEQVLHYLQQHPEFFDAYPQARVMAEAAADQPDADVLDFNRQAIASLKRTIDRERREQAESLDVARHYHARHQRIDQAVLQLMKSTTPQRLFETLAVDLPLLLEMDLVRLVIESQVASELGMTQELSSHTAAFQLVPPGAVGQILPEDQSVRYVPHQCDGQEVAALVFPECPDLAAAAIYLRLDLPRTSRQGMLALGSREPGELQPHEAQAAWQFLASAVSLRCDALLEELEAV
jgi:uncharacterized protein YigA (DUF484 family)